MTVTIKMSDAVHLRTEGPNTCHLRHRATEHLCWSGPSCCQWSHSDSIHI